MKTSTKIILQILAVIFSILFVGGGAMFVAWDFNISHIANMDMDLRFLLLLVALAISGIFTFEIWHKR